MSAETFETTANLNSKRHWLARPVMGRLTAAQALLAAILLLSIGLHFYNIQSIGEGNTYYTATVKSMLQSWHNFFFVSAEPGGSVTVDKPPLGFWIEAGFAAVLGVSGFAVTLPNILAGVASVWVLYRMVRRYFGEGAGLAAALALAVTPVSVAVDRNNTIDGMLILTLLLAAWAFIHATETGKLRWLLAGATLVGLGFNIKMLQAFLPLPAFYALYFLGSKTGWGRKTLNLGLATVVLLVVSLSWAAAVDLTPASQRPFVGSTMGNSEMELIAGYNGLNRLLGMMGRRNPGDGRFQISDLFNSGQSGQPQPPAGQFAPPGAGQGVLPQGGFNFGNRADGGFRGPNGDGFRMDGGPGGFDTGQAGPLRFFQAPLAKEMSWVLPFGLLALVLALFASKVRLPLISNEHKGVVLWGGWLVTCLVFFSAAGFFHNYYLATISPALAAAVGMGFAGIEKLSERSRWLAAAALVVGVGATMAFQVYLTSLFGLNGVWVPLALAITLAAIVLAAVALFRKVESGRAFRAAGAAALAAMLLVPAAWSVKTISANTSTMLPEAYSGDANARGGGFGRFNSAGMPGAGGFLGSANTALVDYLQANTQGIKYMVAVPSSQTGSSLVLETGRPVLFMGGFSGQDPVVNAAGLAQLVQDGELRYVLYGGGGFGGREGSSDVSSWISQNCQVVEVNGVANTSGRGFGAETLYKCG